MVESITLFLEEVLSVFDSNTKYHVREIRISLMVNDEFIFILHDLGTNKESIPYILEDLLVVCKIRKIKLPNISRIFIKVSLFLKS